MNDSFVLMYTLMQCINSAQFTFYSSLVLCAKCQWGKMVILPRKVWLHRRTDTKTSFHVSHKTYAYFRYDLNLLLIYIILLMIWYVLFPPSKDQSKLDNSFMQLHNMLITWSNWLTLNECIIIYVVYFVFFDTDSTNYLQIAGRSIYNASDYINASILAVSAHVINLIIRY